MEFRWETRYGLLWIITTIVVILPFAFVVVFNNWQSRLITGLIHWSFLPILLLFIAFNPKEMFTTFNPKELKGKWRTFRYTGLCGRILIITLSIFVIFSTSIPLIKASIILVSNGWHFDHTSGIIERSRGTPQVIFSRYIRLQGKENSIELMYPAGKQHHRGLHYEFLLLPGTNIAVDIYEISDNSNIKNPAQM